MTNQSNSVLLEIAMLQKFKEHINANFPFLKDKKLLIAISGGVDSVVLTHLFFELNFTIGLAHCNFQLRGKESDLDEDFVRKLSQKMDCEFFVKRFNTTQYATKNKQSIQLAARNLRYHWFQKIIEKHHFDYVLTAHHADDNLETFLINLTRGTGLDGFTGIPKVNGKIVRLLLGFSRDEIITYAKDNSSAKIEWREDESNASNKYIRNKIRHQVIPVLKEINPSLLDTFSKTTENLQESKQMIADRVGEVFSEIVDTNFFSGIELTKINIEKLEQLSNPKAYLYQFLKDYHFTAWDDVYNLLSAQSGKQVFSETHRLLKDRKFLLLSKNVASSAVKKFFIDENISEITTPIHLTMKEVTKISTQNKQTIYIDKDLLKFPLIVKKWDKGDYICPAGMKGSKKISKYFKDAKYSLLEKENAWLLYNTDNELIWIIGDRQDRRCMATNFTKNILKITVS
ncbi:MAG: tRNA lysidine(34) synthetase TilS [Polaribacter sp.]